MPTSPRIAPMSLAAAVFAASVGVTISAHAQTTQDSAAVRDSIAIAASLSAISADSAARQAATLDRARELLATPIPFARGSTRLSAQARELLSAKGWLLWANRGSSVRLIAHSDFGLKGPQAIAQARARLDSTRAYLTTRGIELNRMQGDTREDTSAVAPVVETTFLGPLVVVDVPPADADPPAMTRVSTALEPGGQKRYRLGWVRIFYATDRNRADDPSPEHFFGGDRSPTNALEYGRIEVAVPRLHRPGVIERPAWYRINRAEWSDRFMRVQALTPLDQRAMLDSLRDVVSRSGGKEALVFIHGYNVSFTDAALRTAQLTYDIGFDGAPILYSWPSKASVFRYAADRDAAEWSADHLSQFLESVVGVTGAKRVNVVAHSMGNRALLLALESLARSGRDTLLGNVVLAAADFDAARFQQPIGPLIRPLTQRLTIYLSDRDGALWASKLLAADRRVGESLDPILAIAGMDIVDASNAKTDLLGHGYVASNSGLLDDLAAIINTKRAPPRKLLPQTSPAGSPYWRFP
jgi:esterase/lipase superfamily enzyme